MLGRKETKALKSRDKETFEYFKIPSLNKNTFTEISLFVRVGEGGQNKGHHCTTSPFPHIPNESYSQPSTAPLGATKAVSLTGTEQCPQEEAKKSNFLLYAS